MSDVHSKETRSYNMSRIKGKHTSLKCWLEDFYTSIDSV